MILMMILKIFHMMKNIMLLQYEGRVIFLVRFVIRPIPVKHDTMENHKNVPFETNPNELLTLK